MTIRPRIRDSLPYSRQDHRISELTKRNFYIPGFTSTTSPSRRVMDSDLTIIGAEIVYVKPLDYFDLALNCSNGRIYLPIKGDFPSTREKIIPLRDNSLLLLLQTEKIKEFQRRIFQLGSYSLDDIFRKCVKDLKPRIRKASFGNASSFIS